MLKQVPGASALAGINRSLVLAAVIALAAAFGAFLLVEYRLLGNEAPNYRRFFFYLGLAVLILFAIRVHAHFIARRMRARFDDPLSALAESIRDLTEGRDYTRRLPPAEASEFAELYEGFNEVLGHLQQRETWLVEQSAALKEQLARAQRELREERGRLKTEVSKRRRAQAEMLKLSSALTHAADAVMVTNREGRIEYVNPAFETITGFSREEVFGRTPDILRSDEQDPGVFDAMWKAIQNGEVYRCELVNRRKDGSTFHEEKTITPLKDAHGRITHFIAT
ncbi:MAG TPA: PAS domain-containing protein, partial [Gammaproteobacteria bacterium]